ncbi:ribonuclease domain-containing protein [Parafrankia colletiae]|uniref:ribonuclease domain-containing protein n=1 Tax=Parafrankia colletiae TaxID=573497 RepID=UPI000A02F224
MSFVGSTHIRTQDPPCSTSKGSPLPGHKGGATYKNSNDAPPQGVSYREWDAYNTKPRGAARIVTGSDVSTYYTGDHYMTFARIRQVKRGP